MSTGNGSHQGQLREFAAFTSHAFTIATSFSFSLVSNATRLSFSPFILAYPAISYLVAPLLVFAVMIVNISVLSPLSMAQHILSSLYPVYVFCGFACITGVVVGLGGRGISALLTRAFARLEQDWSAPTDAPATRGTGRRSRRRRLRIQEEDM